MAKLTPKAQRGLGLLAMAAVLGLATVLTLTALEDNVVYFYGPGELAEKPLDGRRIRVGGLVVDGSVERNGDSARFSVTDGDATVAIFYTGILPDLFREGQGIIAEGRYDGTSFEADVILAKHDESYMPKEVADVLKEKGVWQDDAN
ncbi:MAG: cytochrome c maturation protein CcmE [Alphaproteobacteria bacterium]|nr:cytochrome c maturation protein CcmE [Alphaproteobacteria bacterium]